jgi:hypothetical protein
MDDYPIDPINPLNYDGSFDDNDDVCRDFNTTLGWVFYVAKMALEGKGTFEWVRHLRHVLLMALEKKGLDSTDVVTPSFKFTVEALISGNSLILMLQKEHIFDTTQDDHYSHICDLNVWSRSAISAGMILNKNLKAPMSSCISPFGPNDIVFPGGYHPNRSDTGIILTTEVKPQYRTVQLAESFSQTFYSCWKEIDAKKRVFTIQTTLNRLPLDELESHEFSRFIQLVSDKVKDLIKKGQC